MKILLRYILKEVIVPLGVWLAFVFLLLFVMQFLRATEVLLGSAVTFMDVMLLLAYLTPHFLVMALPVAFLLAILLGLGRLSEDREITAMQALGIGPLQILAPAVVMGAFLGVLTFALSSTLEPRGLAAVKGLVNEVIKKNVVGDVKPGVFYEDLSQFTVYAEKVDTERGLWGNVLIHDDRDPAAPLLVLAAEGKVNPGGQGEEMELALAAGDVHRANRSSTDYTLVSFERAEINVGVEDRIRRKNRFRSPREELTPADLLEAARLEKEAGRPHQPYLMAWYARFGQILTPVAFALLGVPLAMSRKGSSRARGLLLTILGYVGYYVLNRAFENMGADGRLPYIVAALVPSLLIAAMGWLAFWRLMRAGAIQ